MATIKAGRSYVNSLPNSSPTCFLQVSVTSTTGTLSLIDPPVAIWVGTAGNLKVTGKDGVSAILPVTVGQNNISPSSIIGDADTTARNIVLGFYHKEV